MEALDAVMHATLATPLTDRQKETDARLANVCTIAFVVGGPIVLEMDLVRPHRVITHPVTCIVCFGPSLRPPFGVRGPPERKWPRSALYTGIEPIIVEREYGLSASCVPSEWP